MIIKGALDHKSRHDPMPLCEREEAALAFAACGITGYALAELPYGEGEGGMMMGGFGHMMGGAGATDASIEMTVTADQAVEAAQTYLNSYFSQTNLIADEHADPFYGYYTLHINRDGQTVGFRLSARKASSLPIRR